MVYATRKVVGLCIHIANINSFIVLSFIDNINSAQLITTVQESFSESSVGFPYKIGCGLGGGNWNIVSKIIEEEFSDDNYHVEIWKL